MPPQYTNAYKRLRTNLQRGRTLLDRFFDNPGGRPRGQGAPKKHEQELLRSVLVLSIGALDAHLSELLIELIPRLAKTGSATTIFNTIMKDSPGLLLQAAYAGPDDLSAAVADAVEGHFQARVMHGAKSVALVSTWSGLALGESDYNTADFPNAFAQLDEWTEKRHRIVHRGELVKLRRADATDVIDLVDHVGRVLNDRALSVHW